MSSTKFALNDFSVKKLDAQTDLTGFVCSESDNLGLDEFIHKEALGYQKESMGVTYLFYNSDKIAGYFPPENGSPEGSETFKDWQRLRSMKVTRIYPAHGPYDLLLQPKKSRL